MFGTESNEVCHHCQSNGNTLMDWQFYDEQFRRSHHGEPIISWGDFDGELYVQCSRSLPSNTPSNQFERGERQFSPPGTCLYSKQNKGYCNKSECNYNHQCGKCSDNHPTNKCRHNQGINQINNAGRNQQSTNTNSHRPTGTSPQNLPR